MNNLPSLLATIADVQKRYRSVHREKGDEFNIFSLLLKSSDEVNLHSKFIHELLNPNGTHHQGRRFLDLFLSIMGIELDRNALVVFREKDHIDILIQTSKEAIIIENKLYTQDHSNQLSRYYNHLQSQGVQKIYLLYLTLFGEMPNEEEVKDRVIMLSYQKEILAWLTDSINSVKDIPLLRETIAQYAQLIRTLTYQAEDQGYIMNVKRLLLEGENLKTLLSIEEAIIEAKIEVQYNFWQTLLGQLIPYYAFSFQNINSNRGLKESIRRYYRGQKGIKDYGIEYQVDVGVYFFVELRSNIYYGFYFDEDETIAEEQQQLIESLAVIWDGVENGVYWRYPTRRLNFSDFNDQNIFDLIGPEERKQGVGLLSYEIRMLIDAYHQKRKALQ